jgi:dephospho-CoA kinase
LKKPLQIGITGGIGSGKSTVYQIFSALGVPVYDADSRAKSLMTTDGILMSQIKKEFGVLSFRADGSVDREYLAQAVFNDQEKLEKLNGLIHPRVAEDYNAWMGKQENEYVLKEAALLFETGSYRVLDKIIVVHAPKELRINRVLKRDSHRTREQVQHIMQNQLSDEEKIKRADFVIMNDESALVIPQVLKLHEQFITLAEKK